MMTPMHPKAPTVPVPDSVGQLVAGARQRLKQAVHLGMAPHDLTPQQYWMILVIVEHGPMSLHRLAQRIFVDDPTASRLVKTLVDRGIFHAGADPAHGRRLVISLGPQGVALQDPVMAFTRELRAGILEGLSPEEQLQAVNLLGRILLNLDRTARHFRDAASTFRQHRVIADSDGEQDIS